jgi:hypothetical protein
MRNAAHPPENFGFGISDFGFPPTHWNLWRYGSIRCQRQQQWQLQFPAAVAVAVSVAGAVTVAEDSFSVLPRV